MRDPGLVQRGERAATALEKAWIHWRVRHGLGSGQLPPVSSYVGYSLTEPWGQPRVVFGIDADEAERLAAILEGHDCVGPVHAEIASRPERWQQAEAAAPAAESEPAGQPAGIQPVQAMPVEPVPVQAMPVQAMPVQAMPVQAMPVQAMPVQAMPVHNVPAQPVAGAEGPQPPLPATPAQDDSVPPAGADLPDQHIGSGGPMSGLQQPRAQFATGPDIGWPVPPAAAVHAPTAVPAAATMQAATTVYAATTAPTALMAPAELAAAGAGDGAAEELTAEQPILPTAMQQAAATADLPAALPAEALAYLQDLATRSAGRDALPAFPAAPVLPAEPEVSHVPAERTRQPEPPLSGDDAAEARGQDQIARARLMPVSTLNHGRRPPAPSGEAGSWPAGSASQRPTDTAV